jgi:hypothetical protein
MEKLQLEIPKAASPLSLGGAEIRAADLFVQSTIIVYLVRR